MKMKFIYVDNILQNQKIFPPNSDTKPILDIIALETYISYLLSNDKKSQEKAIQWYKAIKMEKLPSYADIYKYKASQVMKLLLAYVILKESDTDIKWSFHIGTYESDTFTLDIWYLQAGSFNNTLKELTINDISYETPIIVSTITEGDLLNGSLLMNDTPICSSEDIIQYELRYRYSISTETKTYPLPVNKPDIMKWLRRIGILNDKNVEAISSIIDNSLSQFNIDSISNILDSDICMESIPEISTCSSLLIYSILKIKAAKTVSDIFLKYPPDKCTS